MTAPRVVHVVRSDAFAGVERYVVDTAGELASRGLDVAVIGGDGLRMAAELPPTVPHLPGATVAEVARALWSVGRCDVVHAHMTAAELPAALLKRPHGRLVVTRHFAGRRGASTAGRLAARLITRRVDRQISISRFVADAIGEPSTVIHNGVRASRIQPLPRRPVVVVLQRLEPEKDTATALRAWACSDLAAAGWHLEIYGRGSQREDLEVLRHELGVQSSVTVKGFTDNPRAVLAGAGILLATAPAEPFGLTVVEGMAEGIPIIASSGGAHPETIGPHGSLFSAGDVEACAAEMRRLAGAPEVRAVMGEALAKAHAAGFTIEGHVDRLVECYSSVLDRTSG